MNNNTFFKYRRLVSDEFQSNEYLFIYVSIETMKRLTIANYLGVMSIKMNKLIQRIELASRKLLRKDMNENSRRRCEIEFRVIGINLLL